MKKAWLVSSAFVLVTFPLPAFAADLAVTRPVKAPPMAPVALYNWTGCYVGGHVGGAFSDDSTTSRLGVTTSHDSSGFLGGGQVGCDYQFAPAWVLGAEGRGAWSSLKASNAAHVVYPGLGMTFPSQLTVSNNFLASATARLGYSFADRWLYYVKGGGAWTNEKVDDAYTFVRGIAVDPSTSSTRTGWTVGTGVEWAFAPKWSTTLEYDFCDFGSKGLTLTDPHTFVTINKLTDEIHTVTVGLNYRF
jgi:outer membrane immunogenic protein